MKHLIHNTWCAQHKDKFQALVLLAGEVGWAGVPSELWPTDDELQCPDCVLVRAKALGMSRPQYQKYIEAQAADLADEILSAWEDDA